MISLGRIKRKRRWEIKRVDFAFVEGGEVFKLCILYLIGLSDYLGWVEGGFGFRGFARKGKLDKKGICKKGKNL